MLLRLFLPFLLLRLRGLDRTELMEALARTPAARAALVAPPTSPSEKPSSEAAQEEEPAAANHPPDEKSSQPREQPLPEEPQLFWAGLDGEGKGEGGEEVRIPGVSGALARRLGGFPFWRGENSCSVVMDQIYRTSSESGLSIYLAESIGEKDAES